MGTLHKPPEWRTATAAELAEHDARIARAHAGVQLPRIVHNLAERGARRVTCGFCWQAPGEPCTPGGFHLARFLRAYRRGLIVDRRGRCGHRGDAVTARTLDGAGRPGTGPAADVRVTAAREFLRHVRTGPKPAALPRQVADREAAELRKLLGQVLDYVDSRPAAVDDGQREVLGQALADAVTYRDPSRRYCLDCEAHPAGLCDDHAADLDLTDAYLALGREFGIEVDR